jgi:hypothetical protein
MNTYCAASCFQIQAVGSAGEKMKKGGGKWMSLKHQQSVACYLSGQNT